MWARLLDAVLCPFGRSDVLQARFSLGTERSFWCSLRFGKPPLAHAQREVSGFGLHGWEEETPRPLGQWGSQVGNLQTPEIRRPSVTHQPYARNLREPRGKAKKPGCPGFRKEPKIIWKKWIISASSFSARCFCSLSIYLLRWRS